MSTRSPRSFLSSHTTSFILVLALAIAGPMMAGEEVSKQADAGPKLEMGDGERNWIRTEGFSRDGRTFTFSEVKIDGGGWLVLHPFRDGKPMGEIYVGATYLPSGVNKNVSVTVSTAPEPSKGTMFIAMLHSDVNDDQTFDFFFVDDKNVFDKAVFEGNTMIAHVIATP